MALSLNKRKLFLLNRSLHRDLGYLCVGFSIIFGLSGLALNHRDDWNPNYIIERKEISVDVTNVPEDKLTDLAKEKFSISLKKKGEFWVSPNQLKIFFPGDTTIVFNKEKSTFLYENIKPRPFLRAFNSLHLNELKGYWIFFSDLYSVCLIYLAISALFMVKGKYGMKGRGGVLVIVGVVIPIFFLFT